MGDSVTETFSWSSGGSTPVNGHRVWSVKSGESHPRGGARPCHKPATGCAQFDAESFHKATFYTEREMQVHCRRSP